MKKIRHSISDEEFIRGNVPMTKEEVRSIVISKLQLFEGCILVDIGAGTGSVSIEAALTLENSGIYAIEKKREALELIQENCKKFQVENIIVMEGSAKDELKKISSCHRAFIGGSSGELDDILHELIKILDKDGRIVLTAITLETVSGALLFFDKHYFVTDLVQVTVSRGSRAGGKTMLKALNPVFIITAWQDESNTDG